MLLRKINKMHNRIIYISNFRNILIILGDILISHKILIKYDKSILELIYISFF